MESQPGGSYSRRDPSQEPTTRPADPAWQWNGRFWEKQCYGSCLTITPMAGSYCAQAVLGGCSMWGQTFTGVDDAAADALLLSRLVRLYQLDQYLSHPRALGDLARPLPPELGGFHPAIGDRISELTRRLNEQGPVPAAEYVASLAYSLGASRLDPIDLTAAVACLIDAAEKRGIRRIRLIPGKPESANPECHPSDLSTKGA